MAIFNGAFMKENVKIKTLLATDVESRGVCYWCCNVNTNY